MLVLLLLLFLVSSYSLLSMEDVQGMIAELLTSEYQEPHANCANRVYIAERDDIPILFSQTIPLKLVDEQSKSTNIKTFEDSSRVFLHPDIEPEVTSDHTKLYIFSRMHNNCFRDDAFVYTLGKMESPTMIFDGMNRKKTSVVACCTLREPSSAIYHLVSQKNLDEEHVQENLGVEHVAVEAIEPIITERGHIEALTLHNGRDRIVYSKSYDDKCYVLIKDIGETRRNRTKLKIEQLSPALFKKIVALGNTTLGKVNGLGDVYLGLTVAGRLITFWLNKEQQLKYAEQQHSILFSNIAVDNTRKYGNLRHHLALIDNDGNVFFTDFLYPGNPKLIHSYHTLFTSAENKILGFYLDRGICSITTKDHIYTLLDPSHRFYGFDTFKNICTSIADTASSSNICYCDK